MIRLLKVEVEGKKLRWLYFMNVILFFFFLALALLRISTNMNIKKTSFGKRKQRWIQGEGQERKGGERTPSHKNCGYFYFLSESMIPPTTGWHITAKFPRLKHLSRLFRLLCKKKNESKIKPLNQKFLDPTLPLCIQTC